LQVSGAGLKPDGSDSRTQAAVYRLTPGAKNAAVQFKVVGDAPVVSEEGEHGPGDGHDHDQAQAKVVRLSNRVMETKVVFLSGFGIVLVAALLFGLRQKSAARQTAAAKTQAARPRTRRD
jgi:hypothetical protein